ncbi:MAG: hypothetical protein DI538_05730 [Azospira oryzae]|nr:MAG: hypothetical protein DI538_05730 [Azospira oryzae]
MSKNTLPPRWAQQLLKRFSAQATREEVEGDLRELFLLWVKQYGLRKARWKYIRTVFTVLRPFQSSKRSSTPTPTLATQMMMILSYFKMSWRTLLKNKVTSLINISGLTIGLTTSILILLVVMDELRYDQFHQELNSLHVLMRNQKTNDGISTGESTAGPMAAALRTDFAEVKYAARVAGFGGEQLNVNDKITYESGIYADPDLLRMMTFPSVSGNAVSTLEQGNGVVVTSSMATKLFADTNPIGQLIVFNKHHALTVGAVMEDVPVYSSIRFDLIIPFSVFEKENEWLKKWDDNRITTYVQLHSSADLPLFNSKMTRLLQERSEDKTVTQFAYPFKDLYLHGSFSNGHPDGGRITVVYMLTGFGAFMLLIACINFMNIATAQSEYRAREVGVRKVLGASRKGIAFQFLNESFLITSLSLVTALSLVYLVLPSFNTMTHASVQLHLTRFTLWAALMGIVMITSLVAGSYPALFLSRFLPVKVLKGRITDLKGGGLRKGLVTFQFIISIFCLISTIIMYSQFDYVQHRPMGYEQKNLIDIRLDSTLSSKFGYLKNEAARLPGIRSVTGGSGNILYSGGSVTGMDWTGKRDGEELSIVVTDVDYNWTTTIGLPLVAGRDFEPQFASDSSSCLINESAVAKMGLTNPVGSVVGGHTVVGVFQNFVYNNPFGSIAPMALFLQPNTVRHLYLRVDDTHNWKSTLDTIEKICKQISPEHPFQFRFTQEEYQQHFHEMADTSLMISIFAGMTIFISCLGLFGLSGFVAERRSKEMSIRKVFGAGILRVLISLSQDFLRPVFYALVLVIPLSVWVARWVLSHFNYRVPLRWWMFASGGTLILAVALIIVLYHGWRTAQENPVTRLRNE